MQALPVPISNTFISGQFQSLAHVFLTLLNPMPAQCSSNAQVKHPVHFYPLLHQAPDCRSLNVLLNILHFRVRATVT